MARLISTLGVIILFVAVSIATACLYFFGDWNNFEWGLTLTLRILWGVWVVVFLATILTRVAIFGWWFRKYIRHDKDGTPLPRRAATAPWYKSGVTSFATTVFIVSLTGVFAIAAAVIWILKDVIGDDNFWLVIKILGSSWWVLFIAAVLTRLYLFGKGKYNPGNNPPTTQTPIQPK